MTIKAYEKVTYWVVFEGISHHNAYHGPSKITDGIWALYELEDLGTKRPERVRAFVYFGYVDRSPSYDDTPVADDAEMFMRVGIFTRAVRRLSVNQPVVKFEDDGLGSFEMINSTRVKYTTDCQQEFEFALSDLLEIADWLDE